MAYKKKIFVFLFILLVFSFAFLFIMNKGLLVDEEAHYLQIKRALNWDFGVYNIITVIPGYHYFFAFLGWIFGIDSIRGIRFFNLVVGLISISVFLLIGFRISRNLGLIKGFQYAFFPILFPFFFLIYTDVLSLLLILLSFYFVSIRRYNFAGIFGILSFFVRQNNVVWLGFIMVFVYFDRYDKIDFGKIKDLLRECWTFILGIVIAVIFFILNKGFAFGDRNMHEGGIYFGNILFALFLFFFLFLPLNIFNFKKIIGFVKKKNWILLVILFLFIIYMKFFIVNHPYNFIAPDYFLRNMMLGYFNAGLFIKSLLFLPIAYSFLSLWVTELRRKSFYLLYLFSFLFLSPSWLIEQRYYLIPLSFFILFKKEESTFLENCTIALYFTASILLFYFIGIGKYFL